MRIKQVIKISFLLMIALLELSNDARSQGPDTSFHLINTNVYDIVSFSVNSFGDLYVINSNNQLKKISQHGDSVGVFNEVSRYGQLSYVEVQNPWRTILFYQNFSTIVLLDKYLNVLSNLNLRSHNLFRIKNVTSSYDNNIWVFDEEDSKLKKINDQGKILLETVDLRNIFDSVPSPITILDHAGFVYLYDPKKGLYVFDHYGTFKNKLTFLNWKDVNVAGKFIYGFDENNFYRYNIGTLNLQEYRLPGNFKNYSSLKVVNGRLYMLKKGELGIYDVN